MKHYKPTKVHEMLGGVRRVYEFDNSYSASVICHNGSYGNSSGLWELAIQHKGVICGNTPISTSWDDEVIGWLTEREVQKLLNQIDQFAKNSRMRL